MKVEIHIHLVKYKQLNRRLKVKVDYQKELKKIQESGSYWKPKAGKFKVKSLSELEETEPYIRKEKDKETGEVTEKSTPQYKLKILVDGEEKVWTFGHGFTSASTYGQIVELAVKNNNKLIGVEFTVAVKSDGTKNDYTIVD
jgi:hypothetical protein